MTANAVQRNRRALIALAVAGGLYLAVSQILLPAYDRFGAAPAEASQMEAQLQKYRTALSHRGNYDALETDTRRKLDDLRTRFFTSDAAGSAELQKLVEESAKQAGIDLAQRTATQSRKIDEFVTEISMTATFESSLNQLTSFLTQLRASPKAVNVRMSQIDPVQIAYEPPKQGEVKKSVRVNLTIAGDAVAAAADKVQ